MSELQQTEVADPQVPCRDPECEGVAEVEQDGNMAYYECQECEMQFGYRQLDQPDHACGIGVPESVRKIASYDPTPKPKTIPLKVV